MVQNGIPPRASRRLIKFAKRLASEEAESDEFDDVSPLTRDPDVRKLAALMKGVRFSRAFKVLPRPEIDALVRLAQERDARYRAPDFHSYYYVDTRNGDGWEQHDQVLSSGDFRALIAAVRKVRPGRAPSAVKGHDKWWPHAYHFHDGPHGTGAPRAWAHTGGDGAGVRLADIELVRPFPHPKLPRDRIRTFGESGEVGEESDHATAVLGLLLGQGEKGTIGAAPGLTEAIVCTNKRGGRVNTAAAIMLAVSKLDRGDVLLIEHQHETADADLGSPAEFEDAVYEAIRLATALGIVVVEPGGNGNEAARAVPFDAVRFEDGSGFDRSGGGRDSLAIVVSAAQYDMSAPGYRRWSWAPYGRRVDCFARGDQVTTCRSYPGGEGGDGDMTGEVKCGAPDEPKRRSAVDATFGGTSAAAAIIAATAVQLQGIVKHRRRRPLWPEDMRSVLSNPDWGTAAVGEADKPIGSMPSFEKILANLDRILAMDGDPKRKRAAEPTATADSGAAPPPTA